MQQTGGVLNVVCCMLQRACCTLYVASHLPPVAWAALTSSAANASHARTISLPLTPANSGGNLPKKTKRASALPRQAPRLRRPSAVASAAPLPASRASRAAVGRVRTRMPLARAATPELCGRCRSRHGGGARQQSAERRRDLRTLCARLRTTPLQRATIRRDALQGNVRHAKHNTRQRYLSRVRQRALQWAPLPRRATLRTIMIGMSCGKCSYMNSRHRMPGVMLWLPSQTKYSPLICGHADLHDRRSSGHQRSRPIRTRTVAPTAAPRSALGKPCGVPLGGGGRCCRAG